MSQNINLYVAALRKEPQPITLARVVLLTADTLAALGSYHVYQQERANGVATEIRSAEGLLQVQRGYVTTLQEKEASGPRSVLETEIARLEAELKVAREAMNALKRGALGNQQGFAEYLRAFSRQAVNGLWLTGFSIHGSGELELRGRALSPDIVPGYIQRLNREEVLAGRGIARLEMHQPAPADAMASRAAETGPEPRVPRFLEFSLATNEAAAAGKQP